MKTIVKAIIASLSVAIAACSSGSNNYNSSDRAENFCNNLIQKIDSVIPKGKGEIGVAVISSAGDTVLINNEVHYPLMSVFKLHEAIAVGRTLDSKDMGFDTLLEIKRSELNPNTWSPMLNEYPTGDVRISLSDLMGYMLRESDNNASNILFDKIVTVSATDSICRTLGLEGNFNLSYTEHEMQNDHRLSYYNWSSPLACAELIYKVYNDSIMSDTKQKDLRGWLEECVSATDRLMQPVGKIDNARMGHRTGSGYINEQGEIIAVNDVGYITLPNGMSIALAVLVKDYKGSQDEASALIARIGEVVLDSYK